jgi:hypothetical protein
MDEPDLRGEGKTGGGERPKPKRGAVHRKRKQGGKRQACEDQLSHGRPPNAPWSLSVPGRRAPRGHYRNRRKAPIRLFALYGPVGPSTSSLFTHLKARATVHPESLKDRSCCQQIPSELTGCGVVAASTSYVFAFLVRQRRIG